MWKIKSWTEWPRVKNAQYCVSVMMWHLEVPLDHAPEATPLKGVLTCGHERVLCHTHSLPAWHH